MTAIIHLPEVGSTNTYTTDLLATQWPEEGTVFWTSCQRAGRGQGSNVWESEPGMNLCFSIVLYPHFMPVAKQFRLSKLLGVALVDFADALGVKEASVKWPNDLYAGQRKLGGILVETAVTGSTMKYAVAGVGINVNQTAFSSALPNPVSLVEVAGGPFEPAALMPQLARSILQRYEQARNGQFAEIDHDYHARLYRKGVLSTYADATGEFAGTIDRVGEEGRLYITGAGGKERKYWLKEVVFM